MIVSIAITVDGPVCETEAVWIERIIKDEAEALIAAVCERTREQPNKVKAKLPKRSREMAIRCGINAPRVYVIEH